MTESVLNMSRCGGCPEDYFPCRYFVFVREKNKSSSFVITEFFQVNEEWQVRFTAVTDDDS